jgi:hypothetical protein
VRGGRGLAKENAADLPEGSIAASTVGPIG